MPNEPTNRREGESVGESAQLADDELYLALASTQRRRLLHVLLESRPDGTSVDELATLLCGWDATDAAELVTPAERRRTLVALRHVHLPRLADVGLIDYDPEAATVDAAAVDAAVAEVIEGSIDAGRGP